MNKKGKKKKFEVKKYRRKALHGVGHKKKEWASFMKGPNRSHIFKTLSISAVFFFFSFPPEVCFTDVR